MSVGGRACTNPSHREHWRVTQRKHNVSAFNGYHYTPSDYSTVTCTAPTELGPCGPAEYDGLQTDGDGREHYHRAHWRTKAAYVDGLPG